MDYKVTPNPNRAAGECAATLPGTLILIWNDHRDRGHPPISTLGSRAAYRSAALSEGR